jgi:hypothetical protein
MWQIKSEFKILTDAYPDLGRNMKLVRNGIKMLLVILLLTVISVKGSYRNNITSYSIENSRKIRLESLLDNDNVFIESNNESFEILKKDNSLRNVEESKKLIVKFDKKIDSNYLLQSLDLIDYEIIGDLSQKVIVINSESHTLVNSLLEEHIISVENNIVRELHDIPNDEHYGLQWGHSMVNIVDAWKITVGNDSAYTCVIDSGIHRSHPDLINADIRNGWDYITNDNVMSDIYGHGTKVTGVIAATTNNSIGIAGINWNVTIIPFRVVQDNGLIYSSHVISAIYDAADIGCKVINLSLGGPDYSVAENDAIQYAISKGSIVVASAGNKANSVYQYPASYDNVISVAAINQYNLKSSFSTYNNRVTVTAPGEKIATTSPPTYSNGYSEYEYVDGTSFSAPYIAGIAALSVSVSPDINAVKFKELLISTSIDRGIVGYDNEYGYGLVNAGSLLSFINGQLDKVLNIEILSPPSKINYISFEPIDTTSGIIRAHKASGNYIDVPISSDMLSGYDPYSSVYGSQTVTVTYQGVTTTFDIYLNPFLDVPYDHRNYTHINALVGLGIINGYSDNTFRPNNTLTRAQAAIMIVRAAGLSIEGVSSSFTDVPPTHAAYKFISAAYQAGIINGYSDGTFKTNENVTRAQIAIMVQQAFNVQASEMIITFTDVPEGYAPKKFIETLASQKIVNGYSDGTFRPLNNVTRAQFSTMIYNAIQYVQKTE